MFKCCACFHDVLYYKVCWASAIRMSIHSWFCHCVVTLATDGAPRGGGVFFLLLLSSNINSFSPESLAPPLSETVPENKCRYSSTISMVWMGSPVTKDTSTSLYTYKYARLCEWNPKYHLALGYLMKNAVTWRKSKSTLLLKGLVICVAKNIL